MMLQKILWGTTQPQDKNTVFKIKLQQCVFYEKSHFLP